MVFSWVDIDGLLSSSSALSSGRYEVRIGFDMGSGSTKVKAITYDTYYDKNIDSHGNMNVPIGYQKDISSSNDGHTLTETCMIEGMQKLLGIINHFKDVGVETIKCAGIATAWARNAYNSSDYLDILNKFGIYIHAISQKEEGEIGFKVAENKMMTANDNAELVVLDIGGGSFQLTHHGSYDLEVFNGPYGSSNFGNEVREHTANFNEFLNYDEVEMAREYAKSHINFEVVGQEDKKIAGIGQFLNIGIKGLLGKEYIELSDVKDLISDFSNMTVAEANLKYPKIGADFMLAEHTNLILLEAIMEAESVDTIHLVDAKSVDYVIDSPSFWEDIECLNYDAFSEYVSLVSGDEVEHYAA